MASQDAESAVSPESFGTKPADVADRWKAELSMAEQEFAPWFRRGKKIIQRYKDERPNGKGGANAAVEAVRQFAILWSNVQTLGPAIYARTPIPLVSRRFKDSDPLGRQASEVLERAISYSCEEYDFDRVMIDCRQDYLLVGRGQAWVRYVPHMKTNRIGLTAIDQAEDGVQVSETVTAYVDPEGNAVEEYEEDDEGPYIEAEEVEYEEVVTDHVAWDDFFHNPCREWCEVRWVARRVYMTRDELVARFGKEVGSQVPLDWSPKKATGSDENPDLFKKAQVFEIWDKADRKAYWISKSYTAGPLDERDDPLGLKDFFPCPPALYATLGPDKLIPIPDYVEYQDQAEELDDLTQRIGKLTEALRLVGFYAGEAKTEIARVFTPGFENKLIPVESWAAWSGSGGIKGMMEWVPIRDVVEALKACFEARQRIIDDIYQITGISDILRGDTNPHETATAQGIKAQWGSLRVRDRQKLLSQFARDIIRIKGEIIAEKFSVETIKQMTGVQMFDSPAQKQEVEQQLMMQAQMAQAQGQQPPPPPAEVERMMGLPTWEEVDALLKDNAMRSFRIEIETDSTIEPDESEQKQQAVEFVTALGTLISNALPAIQAAPQLMPMIGESIKFVARRFRIGREMEDIIDRTVDSISQMPPAGPEQPPPPPPPDPAGELKAQTDLMRAQTEQQRTQVEAALGEGELQLKAQELAVKAAALARDPTPQGVA